VCVHSSLRITNYKIFKLYWLLYIPPALTFSNSAFLVTELFVRLVWFLAEGTLLVPYTALTICSL
jgi:hypothetical protein